MSLLWVKGIHLHHYLDDLLLMAQDKNQLLEHRGLVISTLQDCGWLLNLEKSHLEPSQFLVFLGAHFKKVKDTISLPEEKVSMA